jgi:hypothetical protein
VQHQGARPKKNLSLPVQRRFTRTGNAPSTLKKKSLLLNSTSKTFTKKTGTAHALNNIKHWHSPAGGLNGTDSPLFH